MKIALLEAYYGGSHRRWADELSKYCTHNIRPYTLSDKHWRWRLIGGAEALAKQLNERPDLMLTTSMTDLGRLKSFLPNAWGHVPSIYYMHENQWSYPQNSDDPHANTQILYGYIQLASALCADQVVFNSQFHKHDFLKQAKYFYAQMPDQKNSEGLARLEQESIVIPPGLDLEKLADIPRTKPTDRPLILWNHRWEFDKNPELFLNLLLKLEASGQDFGLILLGPHKASSPIFQDLKSKLSHRIDFDKDVTDERAYLEQVARAHLQLVTSKHDFFGYSVVEAAALGVYPILPKRLAYPEHFPGHWGFYNSSKEAVELLKKIVTNYQSLEKISVSKYSWDHLKLFWNNLFAKTVAPS